MSRYQDLQVRSAALQQTIWSAICDTREDNITVMLDALAVIVKRLSDYSMKAEAAETAPRAKPKLSIGSDGNDI